jgi:hypothetical protein
VADADVGLSSYEKQLIAAQINDVFDAEPNNQ